MISLIDYGAGNLTSVCKALAATDATFALARTVDDCATASGLIVPGVGHFAATAVLRGAWADAIAAAVRAGTPVLGICLGMQWLFEASDESPGVRGLGLFPGRIARLTPDSAMGLKVPHVGWNTLEFRGVSRLLDGVAPGSAMYFAHAFAAPLTVDCVASTAHTTMFASVVERDHVFGVQFHPEKSGDAGLRIMRNFVEACG